MDNYEIMSFKAVRYKNLYQRLKSGASLRLFAKSTQVDFNNKKSTK